MKTAPELFRFYGRALLATLGVTAAACALASHLILNRTESLPLGFYWLRPRSDLGRGTLVAFPIPTDVRQLVHDRRYVPDGAYLVKPVVALPGDHVCNRGGAFMVNDEMIGRVLTHDGGGRALPRDEACGPVPNGLVYVASRHPRSFDSRTFGPVHVADIRGEVKPLWTF